jgi:hydroxymethylpyrimidine/phosphomethylpyrimidine kinase
MEHDRGRRAVALTIAGSDSGGGAGIQADLKTFEAHGVFGASAITAITAQNTLGVRAVAAVPPQVVADQVAAVLEDLPVDAIKTGMLMDEATVRAVCAAVRGFGGPIVVDPVMISKSGAALLLDEAVDAVVEHLLPLAAVVTPNLPEAERLTRLTVRTEDDMLAAARALHRMGPRVVVVKGGHLEGEPRDLVFDGERVYWLDGARVDTTSTHGTGCTFAAAVAARLALGESTGEALHGAKAYLLGALREAPGLGHGYGPVAHFHSGAPIRLR